MLIIFFKKAINLFLKIKIIRNFFNLSWDPNYDVTFYHTCSDLKKCIKIINTNKSNRSCDFSNLDTINNNLNKDFNHAILPLITILIKSFFIKKIKILDYGAGSNPVGLYIKKYTNLDHFCCSIDKPDVVDKNNSIIKQKNIKNIQYYKYLDEVNVNEFDVIYFGSSLQYLYNEDYKILKKIFNYNPKIIVINRTFFTSLNKDLYSTQALGRKCLIPNKFYSFKKIVNFFLKFKFKLIFNYDHQQTYLHNNLKNNLFSLKTIIFKSISNKKI